MARKGKNEVKGKPESRWTTAPAYLKMSSVGRSLGRRKREAGGAAVGVR